MKIKICSDVSGCSWDAQCRKRGGGAKEGGGGGLWQLERPLQPADEQTASRLLLHTQAAANKPEPSSDSPQPTGAYM